MWMRLIAQVGRLYGRYRARTLALASTTYEYLYEYSYTYEDWTAACLPSASRCVVVQTARFMEWVGMSPCTHVMARRHGGSTGCLGDRLPGWYVMPGRARVMQANR